MRLKGEVRNVATKEKHAARSKRSSHDRKIGMLHVDDNSNLKTMQRRRLREARNAGIS